MPDNTKTNTKKPRKRNKIKISAKIRPHANFQVNLSTRKKVMTLRKFHIFLKLKMLETWDSHGCWFGNKSFCGDLIYNPSKFHGNPSTGGKDLVETPYVRIGITNVTTDQKLKNIDFYNNKNSF